MRPGIDATVKRLLAGELVALTSDWTIGDIARRLGTYPSQISELRHDKLQRFSIARLLRYISALGYDFQITVTRRPPAMRVPSGPSATLTSARTTSAER